MDILSSYYETLSILEEMLSSLLSQPYSKRDFARIELLEDEIHDVEFAICEMKRMERGNSYRPRGKTLKHRADLYVGL